MCHVDQAKLKSTHMKVVMWHIKGFAFPLICEVSSKNYLFLLGRGSESQRMICVSRESSVTEPCVVMRNMRQVMNGLKNYTGEVSMIFKKKLRFCVVNF